MKGAKDALIEWEKTPHEARLRLLNKVYCRCCKRGRAIANANAVLDGGVFLIKGNCVICGTDVVRYVER